MGMIENIEKINIIKRSKVKRGMEFIEDINRRSPIVDKVMIFGSSVRNDCDNDSDIDICLFTNADSDNPYLFEIYGKLPIVTDDLCDILRFNKIDDKLKTKILTEGVIVYELLCSSKGNPAKI